MKRAIFILGMHRSGTSALARIVNLLGADLGSHLMKAAEDNQKGFFEHEPIVAIHEQLLTELGMHWSDSTPMPEGWLESEAANKARSALAEIIESEFKDTPLWALKDPRQCRLMPLWFPLLKEHGIKPHFIIAYRHPEEVAASLAKRDGISKDAALETWLTYTVEALFSALDYPHAIISYDEIMHNWKPTLEHAAKELTIEWPTTIEAARDEITSFISPKLRNHKAKEIALSKPIESALRQLQKPSLKTLEKLAHDTKERAEPYTASLRQSRLEQLSLKQQFKESQKFAAKAEHRTQDLEKQFVHLKDELDKSRQKTKMLEEALNKAEKISKEQIALKEQERINVEENYKAQLETLYNSTSWKVTQPLRRVKALVSSNETS